MKRILNIFALLLVFSSFGIAQGGAGATQTKMKGMFVYNFVKNVDWPSSQKSGDFLLHIMGDKELYNMMNATYAGKVINNQKIVIKFVSDYSGLTKCHLLYVAPDLSNDLSKHAKTLKSNKTLVVTDKGGLLYNGSVINFVSANNKLAFEISKTNAEMVPLTIGPALLKMASSVI